MCKFAVLLNKPIAFFKFSLLSPLSLLKLPANCFGPPQTIISITEHSFPWITRTAHQRRLQNKQTDDITGPTVYYKTLYNKDKRTEKLANNILHKYHNPYIPKLTKAYCNSTKPHTLLLTYTYKEPVIYQGGGEGWYNVFSQVNFFLPFPNFLQKNCNPPPCIAQKSHVPPHTKRFDRDY